jgi:hypothetical protein
VTVPNSMLPGEGIASREEGCRRVAWFLFPASHFPFRVIFSRGSEERRSSGRLRRSHQKKFMSYQVRS